MSKPIADLLDIPAVSDEMAWSRFSARQDEILAMPGVSTDIASKTWKAAGRRNASSASEQELQELLAERAALLRKKLKQGKHDGAEEARLQYVRWSLDRIEDARHGHHLDRLQQAVDVYQAELLDLQRLNTLLRSRLPAKGKRS